MRPREARKQESENPAWGSGLSRWACEAWAYVLPAAKGSKNISSARAHPYPPQGADGYQHRGGCSVDPDEPGHFRRMAAAFSALLT